MSTSNVVFDDERKEMFFFFFFEVSISENFLSPVLLNKSVDGSKVHMPDVEAAKLFLIDELKLEQFFF